MITFDDVYDIKKNGALVIGRNRLDDYATKFLSKYCKEALERPMPLPVTDILKKMGLHVLERSLSKNLDIFGCCTMFACDIEVFDEDGVHKEHFQEGNIIIDPKSFRRSFYLRDNRLCGNIFHLNKPLRNIGYLLLLLSIIIYPLLS